MEFVKLQFSDLQVSRLCMGGCPMGGYGWGTVDKREVTAAVHAAQEMGVNFFDTADVYGLGQSERTLGNALRGRRDRAVIATKFGVRVENGRTFYDNSPGWVARACEESLRRLQTDYIDLYQIHYRDGTPIEQVADGLRNLQKQGKIRYFGLSNVENAGIDELKPFKGEFVSCQNEYSLACRKHEGDMLALSREMGVSLLTWGSLGQGVLTGKYGADAAFGRDDRRSRENYVNFRGEKLTKNLQIVEAMRPIAQIHGVSVSAVAVRFILDNLPGSVALCGVKRPGQLLSDALDWNLSAGEIQILDRVSNS